MEMRLNRIQLMGRIGLVPCPSMRKIDERNRYFPVGKPENVPAQETMLRMLPGVLRGRAKTSKCQMPLPGVQVLWYNNRTTSAIIWEFWQKRFALLPTFCPAAFRLLFGRAKTAKRPGRL